MLQTSASRMLANDDLRNAMVLNACLSVIYILIGSFRGLLNFKGKLSITRRIGAPMLFRHCLRSFATSSPLSPLRNCWSGSRIPYLTRKPSAFLFCERDNRRAECHCACDADCGYCSVLWLWDHNLQTKLVAEICREGRSRGHMMNLVSQIESKISHPPS